MRKFKCFLLAILLVSLHGLTAQITITSASMPAANDTIRYSTASPSGIGTSWKTKGGNQTWDFSTLTSTGQSYYNFTHQAVTAVDASSGINGYYSTKITVSTNTLGIVTAFSTDGDLRKSIKISAYGAGAGTLYYQQVQIAGDA